MEAETGAQSPPLEWPRIRFYAFYFMAATAGAVFLDFAIDSWVIARYLETSSVGIYAFAVSLVVMANQLNPIMVFRGLFDHIILRVYAQSGDKKDLFEGSTFLNKLSFFMMFPLLMAVCTLAEEIIVYLFKPEYLAALPLIYVFSAMFVLRSLSLGFGYVIGAMELANYRFYGLIFSVYNLVADVVLVQIYGILGVAIATGSAAVLLAVYNGCVVGFVGRVRIHYSVSSYLKIVVATAASFVLIYMARAWISGLFSLFGVAIFGALVFLVLARLLKPFSVRERAMVNEYIGKEIWCF